MKTNKNGCKNYIITFFFKLPLEFPKRFKISIKNLWFGKFFLKLKVWTVEKLDKEIPYSNLNQFFNFINQNLIHLYWKFLIVSTRKSKQQLFKKQSLQKQQILNTFDFWSMSTPNMIKNSINSNFTFGLQCIKFFLWLIPVRKTQKEVAFGNKIEKFVNYEKMMIEKKFFIANYRNHFLKLKSH